MWCISLLFRMPHPSFPCSLSAPRSSEVILFSSTRPLRGSTKNQRLTILDCSILHQDEYEGEFLSYRALLVAETVNGRQQLGKHREYGNLWVSTCFVTFPMAFFAPATAYSLNRVCLNQPKKTPLVHCLPFQTHAPKNEQSQ